MSQKQGQCEAFGVADGEEPDMKRCTERAWWLITIHHYVDGSTITTRRRYCDEHRMSGYIQPEAWPARFSRLTVDMAQWHPSRLADEALLERRVALRHQ